MPRTRRALLIVAVLTAALYVIPFGRFVAWPLMLLSTVAHEMGHGLAAILAGGTFQSLEIWANGSGMARHTGTHGAMAVAFVAAGGLVGPALLAAVFFAFARRAPWARVMLLLFGVGAALSVVLVVNNSFGALFIASLSVITILVAVRFSSSTCQIALLFLAVQLSLSVFSRADYLFTKVANTGGGTIPSDVAQIARNLGGPYWLWGILVGGFSLLVLAVGIGLFSTALKQSPPR